MRCCNCGEVIESEQIFCGSCGSVLSAPVSVPVDPVKVDQIDSLNHELMNAKFESFINEASKWGKKKPSIVVILSILFPLVLFTLVLFWYYDNQSMIWAGP
jgi:hypothetical protein